MSVKTILVGLLVHLAFAGCNVCVNTILVGLIVHLAFAGCNVSVDMTQDFVSYVCNFFPTCAIIILQQRQTSVKSDTCMQLRSCRTGADAIL